MREPFQVQYMITFGACREFVKAKKMFHKLKCGWICLYLHCFRKGEQIHVHVGASSFHLKAPALPHLFVISCRVIAKFLQDAVHVADVGKGMQGNLYFLPALDWPCGKHKVLHGYLAGQKAVRVVRPLPAAQAQKPSVMQERPLFVVVHSVGLEVRGKGLFCAIAFQLRKKMFSACPKVFALDFQTHD